MEPVVALSQSKRFKLGSALLFRHHEMEIGGIQALMAGNDNYMLKSLGLLKEVVEQQQQQSTLAVNPSSSIRRRSASLSSTPSSGGIILSLKNGGVGVVQRSHPPTPPSSGGSSSRLIPASVNGYSARLLCSCLPGCCCNCSLLSSITECQAVYHHVCARFISSAVDPATTPCEPTPASSPPQTIPQDVVKKNYFLFFIYFV